MTLAMGMSQAERRCTIAHETEHIVRGPVAAHDAMQEERAIDRRVATLLIPSLHEVALAMIRARGRVDVAADELWVDDYLLQVRLAMLSAGERAYVARRLADGVS